jgi:hypothetical protein
MASVVSAGKVCGTCSAMMANARPLTDDRITTRLEHQIKGHGGREL